MNTLITTNNPNERYAVAISSLCIIHESGISVSDQKEAIEVFCDDRNIRICNRLLCKSFLTLHSNKIQSLISYLESLGRVDYIVAFSPEHIAETTEDVYAICGFLDRMGVKLLFVEQHDFSQAYYEVLTSKLDSIEMASY